MHTEEYYGHLLEKWLRNEITPGEAVELMDYLEQEQMSRSLLLTLRHEFDAVLQEPVSISSETSERLRQALLEKIQPATPIVVTTTKNKYKTFIRIAASAAIVVSLIAATYFLIVNKNDTDPKIAVEEPNLPLVQDVPAGTSKAILTLADGTQIELDGKGQRNVLDKGAVTATSRNGELVYESKSQNTPVEYNILSSARGQSYSLVLADGSRLWLNAASSVRFPTAFTGNERNVEITGEVFFDIAHDPAKPFHVKVGDADIQVLGTQFNVNAYADERSVRTTLVEGKVLVAASDKEVRLEPGQQARLTANNLSLVDAVNVDEIIAWKNGNFHFDSADLRSILRQFARWYDIEVVYEGEVGNRAFFGIISRNSSLANVLKMLNANDIKFRIEGKKLIVQSN